MIGNMDKTPILPITVLALEQVVHAASSKKISSKNQKVIKQEGRRLKGEKGIVLIAVPREKAVRYISLPRH